MSNLINIRRQQTWENDVNSSVAGVPAPLPTATPALPMSELPLEVKLTVLAYCYILPVVCVVGIVGNAMNVVTLASRKLRAVSYMYLRALAIADLMCMLFVLAFVSCEVLTYHGYTLNTSYWYGFYQRHIMLSFLNYALATGVYIVVALSLERYVSIVFPLHFRQWNSPMRARIAISVACLVPALFYLPYALVRYSTDTKVTPEGETIYIQVDSEISKMFGWKIYEWSREAILRFLPIIVLTVLNAQIMMAFRKRQQMFARLKNREQNHSKDETLLYILGGIVAMFFICNIPAALNLIFINETVKKRVDYQFFRAIANILEITNHAAQFYIFCVCSTDYRATFLQKFPCFNVGADVELPFKAYYTNRANIRALIRRPLRRESVKSVPPPTLVRQTTKNLSTTGTIEAISINTIREGKTSPKEMISDESDSLLHYGIMADDPKNNNTTYL